jgi:hypothetical protein
VEQEPPHLHPLNQAAEMLLKKLGGAKRADGSIAVIELALTALEAISGERKFERLESIRRWEVDPRWQRLALMTIEKSLTPQMLLIMGPQEAGAQIAAILGD